MTPPAPKRLVPPRVVIAPDSFKGSLSATAVAQALARGVAQGWPEAIPLWFPMADGGEGTLQALRAQNLGRTQICPAVDALGRPCGAETLMLADAEGAWVVLEAATVLGLTAAPGSVEDRHSAGLGLLMRRFLEAGHRRFLVGLGGTSTVDGGAGLLSALGVRFLDASGRTLRPSPDALASLHTLDLDGLDRRWGESTLVVLTDVDNVLLGPEGAVARYGAQKGVTARAAPVFEGLLETLSVQYERAFGRRGAEWPGGGAAGGLGAALAVLGGRLVPGAPELARRVGLDAAFSGAAWALTGEGRADGQTACGKTPWHVGTLGLAANVPVSLVAGSIAPDAERLLQAHFTDCRGLSAGAILSQAQTAARLTAVAAKLAAARAREVRHDRP